MKNGFKVKYEKEGATWEASFQASNKYHMRNFGTLIASLEMNGVEFFVTKFVNGRKDEILWTPANLYTTASN